MRRMFHPGRFSRGLAGKARVLAALWIIAGLFICVERTPDLAGHSHAHSPGHIMETWHQEPDDPASRGSSSPASGHHFHVVKDFTSIESDVPALVAAAVRDIAPTGFSPVDETIPEPPAFETEGPPLI